MYLLYSPLWWIFSSVFYLCFGISDFNMQKFYIWIYSKSSIFIYSENSPQKHLTSFSSWCPVAYTHFLIAFHRPGCSPFTALQMLAPFLKFFPSHLLVLPPHWLPPALPSYLSTSAPVCLPQGRGQGQVSGQHSAE